MGDGGCVREGNLGCISGDEYGYGGFFLQKWRWFCLSIFARPVD